jgi:hypothetical protein
MQDVLDVSFESAFLNVNKGALHDTVATPVSELIKHFRHSMDVSVELRSAS